MPNRIESTYIVEREPDTKAIKNVRWYVQNLCNQSQAERFQPEEAVYLNEAFGEGSAQVLNFKFADDEFALYIDLDDEVAAEVFDFLKKTQKVDIMSTVQVPGNITKWYNKQWTTNVTAYADYMAMVESMTALSSHAVSK